MAAVIASREMRDDAMPAMEASSVEAADFSLGARSRLIAAHVAEAVRGGIETNLLATTVML
jgi:hypothetical protein